LTIFSLRSTEYGFIIIIYLSYILYFTLLESAVRVARARSDQPSCEVVVRGEVVKLHNRIYDSSKG